MSPVNCPLPVTCHLTTTLCSFTCYESPRRFGDVSKVVFVVVCSVHLLLAMISLPTYEDYYFLLLLAMINQSAKIMSRMLSYFWRWLISLPSCQD